MVVSCLHLDGQSQVLHDASWHFQAFSHIFTSELRLHCPSLANHGDLQCTETAMEFSHILWQWRAECL